MTVTTVPLPLASASLAALFLVSLLGALVPLRLASCFTPSYFRLANAFASGVLASAAFVHLLPSASTTLAALPTTFPVAGALALSGAALVHILNAIPSPRAARATRAGYVLAAALSAHALLEGLALGASAERQRAFAAMLAAILLHKAFVALSLGAALAASGAPRAACTALAIAFAAVTPAAALAALVIVRSLLAADTARIASASLTALSAGVFTYVAFAELLHHHVDISLPTTCVYGACKHADDGITPARDDSNKPAEAAMFIAAATVMAVLALWT